MISVLADVQIAEAAIQLRNTIASDSLNLLALAEYKYIFDKNHISDAEFRKSFMYYAAHPDMMTEMYKDVITLLSKRQAESGVKK